MTLFRAFKGFSIKTQMEMNWKARVERPNEVNWKLI